MLLNSCLNIIWTYLTSTNLIFTVVHVFFFQVSSKCAGEREGRLDRLLGSYSTWSTRALRWPGHRPSTSLTYRAFHKLPQIYTANHETFLVKCTQLQYRFAIISGALSRREGDKCRSGSGFGTPSQERPDPPFTWY